MQHAPRAHSLSRTHSLSNKETQMEFLSAFNTCYFTNQRRKSRLSFEAVDLLATTAPSLALSRSLRAWTASEERADRVCSLTRVGE